MKKSFIAVIAIAFSIFGLQAFNFVDQPRFTNLQILPKDIAPKDLDSVMNHFTASLNVKCGFCHVRNEETRKMDFASDAKMEKHVARGMMKMAIDINKNNFAPFDESDKEYITKTGDTSSVRYMLKYVTCYTCHHGNAHPENTPPKDEDED